jgi:hypothetical protein
LNEAHSLHPKVPNQGTVSGAAGLSDGSDSVCGKERCEPPNGAALHLRRRQAIYAITLDPGAFSHAMKAKWTAAGPANATFVVQAGFVGTRES